MKNGSVVFDGLTSEFRDFSRLSLILEGIDNSEIVDSGDNETHDRIYEEQHDCYKDDMNSPSTLSHCIEPSVASSITTSNPQSQFNNIGSSNQNKKPKVLVEKEGMIL